MRINKFIASSTSFSRRKADELIMQGKIFLNGKRVQNLGINIDPLKDIIKISEKNINPKNKNIYLALNKPAGYVSTRSDELNRQTVMDLIPKNMNLKPVGRLDLETEGLLLFSNDGEFINRFTHPKFECEKEYFVKIKGELTMAEKQKLESGIILDSKQTSKAKIVIIKSSEKETFLRIVIHEGRKRQIRKMFDYISHPVKYLQRIRIGKIQLGQLEKGKFRTLTQKEIC